jgi:hypothetical protein
MDIENGQTHAMKVGDRAHRIVGELLLRDLPSDRAPRTVEITQCASEVFKAHPITYRPREAYLDAVTAAGVYLNRFRPPAPWRLAAVEMRIAHSSLDIVHELEGRGVLVDELKLGVGRYGESSVQRQIARYLKIGNELWGASFLGVRLCAIHEPSQSTLHVPCGEAPVLLSDSALAGVAGVR